MERAGVPIPRRYSPSQVLHLAGHPTARLGVRVGTDIQAVAAVADAVRRHGRRYLDYVYTEHEVSCCGGADSSPSILAPGLTARFCAKEAVIKLLRPTDVVPKWTDIEVVRQAGGWTELNLRGPARQLAQDSGFQQLSLSLSHDRGFAVATVVGVGVSSMPSPVGGE